MPAARLVERLVVRLAEQQREPHRLVVAHGLDRGVERERWHSRVRRQSGRVETPPMPPISHLAPVPGDVRKIDADMAGKPRFGRVLGASISTRRSAWAHLTWPQGSFSTTCARPDRVASAVRPVGHDASPFRTSISMLIPIPSPCPNAPPPYPSYAGRAAALPEPLRSCQIAVFKPDGTFYKGSR